MISDPHDIAISPQVHQIVPLLTGWRELRRKGFLTPALVTILCCVHLFALIGEPLAFNRLLALYLGVAALYCIYLLCGKPKPWYVLGGTALATMVLLDNLPREALTQTSTAIRAAVHSSHGESTIRRWLGHLLGGAIPEELIKLLPVIAALRAARSLPTPWRERFGVTEPLDGILLGAASAVGFIWIESLTLYVRQAVAHGDELAGLQVLIPRMLSSLAVHVAYSGYVGYCIGLAVLTRRSMSFTASCGLLLAASLHAAWNTARTPLALSLIGTVSYALLACSVIEARRISPTREQNFATRWIARPQANRA